MDSGVIGSINQIEILLSAGGSLEGVRHAVVAECDPLSHWWRIDTADGPIAYIGTEATFARWVKRNPGVEV